MTNVYGEMFLQVARSFAGVDAKSLTMSEIRYFYQGMESELIEMTKPRPSG